MVGQTVSHYKIVSKLGEGGMGEVYLAEDTELERHVALKFLPRGLALDSAALNRFRREARAAARLSHPSIVTIHEIGTHDGHPFIVMAHVEGQLLRDAINEGDIPLERALGIIVQIGEGLDVAHTAGVVHRDIKPENIILDTLGRPQILDFGLAKLHGATALTREQSTLGTTYYMSPEQARGAEVDARSDIFSLGVVAYELIAGQRPFRGEHREAVLYAITTAEPQPLAHFNRDTTVELERIVGKMLAKDPADRYQTAADAVADLRAVWSQDFGGLQAGRSGHSDGFRALLRPRVLVPVSAVLVIAIAAAAWFGVRSRRAHWARNVALPEIARLAENGPSVKVFRLASEARRVIPDDPELQRLWPDVAIAIPIRTTPPGAVVEWKDYSAAEDSPWESLGSSPVEGVMVPKSYLRWRISKEGFGDVEVAFSPWVTPLAQFQLVPLDSIPQGMVRVPGRFQFGTSPAIDLEDYWLDRYEVTNKAFKEFVDAGGYRERKYWTHPFTKDGRELSWEQAMEKFRDTTGRPGPATWALGSYPDGQAEFPVGGVSWYEANAYAAFKGKSLPTVYHWRKAALPGIFSDVYELSNFGTGPVSVGTGRGLNPWGAYDMAGNVKEWCWNQADERRYILGGGWGEPTYMFAQSDAQEPMRRQPNYGFRCVVYSHPPADSVTAAVGTLARDYSREVPVNNETFRLYQSIYSYDRTALNATIDWVDDAPEYWRTEKVSFDAAYGNERVMAYLFLPRNAKPPYQTVVFFPTSDAFHRRSSDNLSTQYIEFLMRSGRAVMYPIYKGTFERGGGSPPSGPREERDEQIQRYRDLGRSVDYLETRQDIDSDRVAYYGFSAGGIEGPIYLALEPRFEAAILLSAGFHTYGAPPEIDPMNFAPHVTIPVLMVNGRQDFQKPLESSQKPMFRFLGTPAADKHHVVFDDSGHFPNPDRVPDMYKEALDWLDRFLGPVRGE